MTRRIAPLALALALPLVATACGSSSSHSAAGATSSAATSSGAGAVSATTAADGVQQVTIDTTDQFRFAPTAVQARVGKLRIVLANHGSYPHNIGFPSLHATSATVSGSPGQQRTTLTVTFAHAGTYRFVCTFHSSAGMKGQVTVT